MQFIVAHIKNTRLLYAYHTLRTWHSGFVTSIEWGMMFQLDDHISRPMPKSHQVLLEPESTVPCKRMIRAMTDPSISNLCCTAN
jgi:hypothetical protein